MRFLVTGCCGFIGSNLCLDLQNLDYEVYGVDNFDTYYGPHEKLLNHKLLSSDHSKQFRFYNVNVETDSLTNILKNNGIDVVIHLAGVPGVWYAYEHPHESFSRNCVGTSRVLQSCVEANVQRFVFASSSSVYGNSARTRKYVSEKDPTNPLTTYGVAKLSCEKLCATYSEIYGITTTALRIFSAYGPRLRPDLAISKAVKCLMTNGVFYINGHRSRDYTYISDVTDAMIRASLYLHNGKHQVFNVGGGKSYSIETICTFLSNIFGKDLKTKICQPRKFDAERTSCDYSKIKSVLDWSPKVDIQSGLRKYADWKRSVISQ